MPLDNRETLNTEELNAEIKETIEEIAREATYAGMTQGEVLELVTEATSTLVRVFGLPSCLVAPVAIDIARKISAAGARLERVH